MTYSPWTPEETEQYKKLKRTELDPVYAVAGIPNDQPEKRAAYLAERLNLTLTDQDLIMRTAASDGKPWALRLLEQMAVKTFF